MSITTDWTTETSFDRYARLVRRTLGVPVGLVTIVEADRQVFPGALGLPEPYQSTRQTPLTHSFCQYVVASAAPLFVPDARLDERLRVNLAIRDLDVIAYAGWPLTDLRGDVIGSLCAIHREPHEWTELELENLADLAAACSTELVQREMVGELERSNEKLAAFAGQVSHDLRNPLAALTSSLELLDDIYAGLRDRIDDQDGSSAAYVLTRAKRSTARMGTLVHDVLDFARVGGRLQLSVVDVEDLVAAAVEDLDLEPGTAPITVGRLPMVRADGVQLQIVVANLLGNALKHAPGSPVAVAATVADGVWCLTVADHGRGVPSCDRDRVLESFVRLDASVPGSGLGLATCLRVAAAHGGSLRLRETPGGGTTAQLRIPTGDPR